MNLCSMLAGHDISEGERVELIAAEFLSGAEPLVEVRAAACSSTDGDGTDSGEIDPGESDERDSYLEDIDRGDSDCGDPHRGNPDRGDSDPRESTGEESGAATVDVTGLGGPWATMVALASLIDDGVRPELDVPWAVHPSYAFLPSEFPGDGNPWTLHETLLEAIGTEREVAWRLGRLLRVVQDFRLWREFGLSSFAEYVVERLGISQRSAQRLVRLERNGDLFPALRRAYRCGDLSPIAASIVLRALKTGVSERAERAWVRYARKMTIRTLREAAADAEAKAAAKPDEWKASGGMPPPLPGDDAPTFAAAAAPPESAGDDVLGAPVDTTAPTFAASAGPPEFAGYDVLGAPADTTAPTFAASADRPTLGHEEPLPRSPDPEAPTFAATSDPPTFAASQTGGDLLRALALEPYPEAWACQGTPCRLEFCLTPGNFEILQRAMAVVRRIRGPDWPTWACWNDLLDHFLFEYGSGELERSRRRYPIFERDGWRCRAPGCTSRSGLHVHHVVFRSQGGGDEPENLVTLCDFHHLALHRGWIRCRGTAPDLLHWEFGLKLNAAYRHQRGPVARFLGERRLEDGELWDGARVLSVPEGTVELDGTRLIRGYRRISEAGARPGRRAIA